MTLRHSISALFSALLICATSFTPALAADDDAEDAIFGTGWGMTLALDGTGFYNDLITRALAGMAKPKTYIPLPYKRAKVEFGNRVKSCIYPGNIEHLARGNEISTAADFVETRSLVFVESHLFSRPGTPALKSLDDLANKVIAYPNGSALPTVLGQYGARFMPTTDETTKARMLAAGRVDYMSGSLPDNIFVFKSLEKQLPPYNPDLALIRVGVGIVCHRTPENEAFVSQIDAAILTGKKRGDLQGLFEERGIDLRFFPPAK